jgi:polyisoprenoid-binding protein YceI/mono/diheme cytochrome c family protein
VLITLAALAAVVAAVSMYAYRQIHPALSKVYTQIDFSKVPGAPHLTAGGGETVYRIDPTRSSLTYRVDERIVGKTASHATGTTNGIAGDVAVDARRASAARVGKIVVDVEQLHSDNRLRDARIRADFLESHEHPLATLSPGTFSGLPATLEEGKTYRFELHAPLTVKGETAPTTWLVSGHLDRTTLIATANTTVKMSTFHVGPIRLAGLVSTSDDVDLTMRLTAVDAARFTVPTEIADPMGPAPTASGPSFQREIAPVLAANCASCHQPGEAGAEHWQLATAEDASKVAEGLGTVVQSGYMPPWPASHVGVPLAHAKTLDQKTIAKLLAWAAAGGPLDEPPSTPIKPTSPPAAAAVPRRDVVLTMPQAYTGSLAVPNDYRCFVLDPRFTKATFVTGYTVTPGRRAEIHHAQIFHIARAQVAAGLRKSGQGGQPGWTCYGGASLGRGDRGLIAGWVPGQDPVHYPENAGVLFQPGDAIVLQIHYHYEDRPTPDRSTVALETAPGTAAIKQLQIVNPLAPVEIPCDPGQTNPLCERTASIAENTKVYGRIGAVQETALLFLCGRTADELAATYHDGRARSSCDSPVPSSGQVIAVMGHMHTLGSSFRLTLDPGQPDEKVLLDIPRWNFDWQMNYQLATPIHVHAGQTVRMDCSWDRSLDPTRPQKYIVFAEGTEDEMCFSTYALVPDDQPRS